MRAVVYSGANRVAWEETAEPTIADSRAAIVRPIAVALCDLDWMIVRGISPFAPPFAFGHEGVARVESVGADVATVKVGDHVIVPFQISCGTCAPCLAGYTGSCASVRPRTSMYGIGAAGGDRGGMLADAVLVPFADAMLVRVPEGLDPISIASTSDNIANGYRCVAPLLAQHPGAAVLILGGLGASVSLYAAACAVALGASRVDYVDANADRRARAEAFGAHALDVLPEKIAATYPIVVDVSGHIPKLHAALAATAPEGTCVVPAIYFGETTPIPLYRMYVKGMTLQTGRVHARAVIPHVLDLIAAGRIRPEAITSQVVPWDDAPEAILAGAQTKLVIERVCHTERSAASA